MTESAEVALRGGTDIEVSDAERELIEANQREVDTNDFTIPLVKLTQPLTNEVASGEVKPGVFYLPLTNEDFGDTVEFIVSGKAKGRFKGGKAGQRSLVARGTDIVPWPEDPFFGQPFSEHPDAEETYSRRANDKEIEWGKGPPIQTTGDFTGHIVGYDVPVLFSIKLSNKFAKQEFRKWNTLLDAVLRGKYWDCVFTLTASQRENAGGQRFFIAEVRPGRATTTEEHDLAVGLAQRLRASGVSVAGDEDASPQAPAVEPDAKGGLDID